MAKIGPVDVEIIALTEIAKIYLKRRETEGELDVGLQRGNILSLAELTARMPRPKQN